MALTDLTTLARVKTWLGIPLLQTTSDAVLQMVITSVSAQVMAYLERRSFRYQIYNDVYDGVGGNSQILRNWPVIQVLSVSVNDREIASEDWSLEPWGGMPPGNHQAIILNSGRFSWSKQNVRISYGAGYQTVDEELVPFFGPLAGSVPYVLEQQPFGLALQTDRIVYTEKPDSNDPTPFQRIDSPVPIDRRTYSYNPEVPGMLWMNGDDVGFILNVSYSYCPYAVEQTVWELINEVYTRRSRPGQVSRALAGQETSTFDMSGLPEFAKIALQPFKSVLPL